MNAFHEVKDGTHYAAVFMAEFRKGEHPLTPSDGNLYGILYRRPDEKKWRLDYRLSASR